MMNLRWSAALLGASALGLLGGCYASETEDTTAIAAALEMENGGYDMEDEAPEFGDRRFADLGLSEEEAELSDEMDSDAEVRAMREAPDAVVYHAQIHWGQLPGNPENRVPRNWTGALVVNRGAILVRRTVLFEGRDSLLPRGDRHALPFASATLPHHDGLIVSIIDPTPRSEEPLVLGYVNDLPGEAGPEGDSLRVPIRALLDGPVELTSDDAGNRMVAAAAAEPVDRCDRGFLAGRWHPVEEGRGVLIGQVRGAHGGLRGHVRGIYGVRESGERVFFGKYINRAGEFRGIFRGTYGEGRFEGRWVVRSGDYGALGGGYREDAPGDELGGHFLGAWREASCDG